MVGNYIKILGAVFYKDIEVYVILIVFRYKDNIINNINSFIIIYIANADDSQITLFKLANLV